MSSSTRSIVVRIYCRYVLASLAGASLAMVGYHAYSLTIAYLAYTSLPVVFAAGAVTGAVALYLWELKRYSLKKENIAREKQLLSSLKQASESGTLRVDGASAECVMRLTSEQTV